MVSGEIYDLHSDFDLEKHKKTFINYLEVVIHPTGRVEYAVPSHQEKLVSIAMERFGVTRKQLEQMTPPEFYFDWLEWLCMKTGCVSVWNDCYFGTPNRFQRKKMNELISGGVLKVNRFER